VSGDRRYAARLRQVEAEAFGRRGEGHVNPSNERMKALVGLLGDPQLAYRAVHLTGTNGKTSTARMTEALLHAFGLRTGRYTSPHLESVTEGIVIDGEPVDDRRFVEAYRELAPPVELVDVQFDVPLSFFELLTALGFVIFADAPVEAAVVEVGMGGHGGHLGQHQGARRRGRGRAPSRPRPHAIPSRHDRAGGHREGRPRQTGRHRDTAAQPEDAAGALRHRAAEIRQDRRP